MRQVLRSRTTGIWALLEGATLLSFAIGRDGAQRPALAGALIIGIACVKVRLVALDFMELRTAPLPWRVAAEALVAVLGAVLIGLFLAAG